MSSENLIIVPLLRPINIDKLPTFGKKIEREFLVSFFNDCNLNCSFCNGCLVVPEEYDHKVLKQMVEDTKFALRTVEEDYVKVKFTGGEILQDKFPDEQIDHYATICKELREYADSIGKKIGITITSNFIFKKRDRIIKFLKDNDIKITASFDLVGRYDNPKLVDLMLDNVKALSASGLKVGINFVAHKGNIDAIMNRGQYIEVFDYLYENHKMMIDLFTAVGKEELDVTEEELADFFIYLYHHYPKIEHIQDLVIAYKDKTVDSHECSRSVWVSGNGITGDCNGNFTEGFKSQLLERGCVSCKHLQYCKGVCSRIFTGKFCFQRKFFDYLEEIGL